MFREVYVAADREPDLLLRSLAAHLVVPSDGALSGHSAAVLLGADCSPPNAPAEIIAPRGDVKPVEGSSSGRTNSLRSRSARSPAAA